MRIIYSQKWAKERVDEKIRKLLPFIPGIKNSDLLIKVFCYTRNHSYRGHYRNMFYHGFWQREWDYFATLKKIPEHHILLKFHPDIRDELLLKFIAHEFGHLRDWRKYKGKKYKCAQKRCDKFAEKCLRKYRAFKINKRS